MQKLCANSWCRQPFEVTDADLAFYEKVSPVFNGKKELIPPPTQCPDCRLQRRTCHRNEQYLYHNKSGKSGKDLISIYAPEAPWGRPFTIYSPEEWRSDDFDATKFGRDVDFSRSFFEQFGELLKDVPRIALITLANQNCDYTTGTAYSKNCYMTNSSENCENCYFGKLLQQCRDSVDCSYLYDSELCYGCFSVYNSYHCISLQFGQHCTDCFFSSNLRGCKNCLLCTNLQNKTYHVLNKPVTKEEFERRVNELLGSWKAFERAKKELARLEQERTHRAANIVNSENCTGDYIENSKHCLDCYDMNDSEDCHFVTVGVNVKDNYDCSNMYLKPELCYETLGTIGVQSIACCLFVFHSQRLLYCDQCYHCTDCFGCAGLTRKSFCILNKQYSKEEYETIVPKMIEHMRHDGENGAALNPNEPQRVNGSWGEFFPLEISPFMYNETLAHEYFPLTKEEVLKRGWRWRDEADTMPKVEKIIPAERLPDSIDKIPDDILNWAIKCEVTGRPFKIIKQELAFYRKMKLPIPHFHPDERHRRRMALRNPRKLWKRMCGKCQKEIDTTYSPERQEKVHCEECYLKEVY